MFVLAHMMYIQNLCTYKSVAMHTVCTVLGRYFYGTICVVLGRKQSHTLFTTTWLGMMFTIY